MHQLVPGKMFCRNLIVSLVLIDYACAHVIKKEPAEYSGYALIDKGAQPIDPDNPPRDGVWMTWEDAVAMANNKRKERSDFLVFLEKVQTERDLAQMRLEKSQEALRQADSPASRFWKTWGFPIGILLGFGIGFGVSFIAR